MEPAAGRTGDRRRCGCPRCSCHPTARPTHRPSRSRTAHDLVARFRATVSPASFTLATRLVIRPAQRPGGPRPSCGPWSGSGPAQLTEVLTSDLVQPRPAPGAALKTSDTRIRYEFVHGVPRAAPHALVLRPHRRGPATSWSTNSRTTSEAVRNLTLRIKDPRNASYERVTPAAEPYLRVELAVHLSLGGPNLVAAARLGQALGSPIPRQVRRVVQPSSVTAHRTMESGMSDRVEIAGPGGLVRHHTDTPRWMPNRASPRAGRLTDDLQAAQRLYGQLPAVVGNLPLR